MRWEEMLSGDSRTAHDAANEAAAKRPGNLIDRQRTWTSVPCPSSSTTPPKRRLPGEGTTYPVRLTAAQIAEVIRVLEDAPLGDELGEALRKLREEQDYATRMELAALS